VKNSTASTGRTTNESSRYDLIFLMRKTGEIGKSGVESH